MLAPITADLKRLRNPAKAKLLSGFFKTGKGEYGEGDVFLGIMVPQQRQVAMKHWKEASLGDIDALLKSKIHEHRLTSLLMLVKKFEKGGEKEKSEIYQFYLSHAKFVNNWDLVDLTAPRIAGAWLWKKDKSVLLKLAKSNNLWERRIAMIATLGFIVKGEFGETVKISKLLLHDEHDLIHKAAGWMLREMGKRGGEKELHAFLKQHAATMPRTMLRYAIERMDEKTRKSYLSFGR